MSIPGNFLQDNSFMSPTKKVADMTKEELFEKWFKSTDLWAKPDRKMTQAAFFAGHASRDEEVERSCEWTPWNDWENPGCYDTACGQTQYFSEEDIKGNNYVYCPYCGAKIIENEAVLKESEIARAALKKEE